MTSSKEGPAVLRLSSIHFEEPLQQPHVPGTMLLEDQGLGGFAGEGLVICWPLRVELPSQRNLYVVAAEALAAH